MKPLVLTFDIGTQSCRGVIVDKEGNFLSFVQKKFAKPYFSLNPNWAEQNSEFYWNSICEVSKELKNQAGDIWNDIKAVSITTIRDTTVCVNKAGIPLRPAIIWLDKREASIKKPLPASKAAILAAAGMTETVKIIRKASACNWIMQNEPAIWDETYKYLLLSGYMNFCFTGKMIDCTANIIAHVPFDNKKQKWMSTKDLTYQVFPVPKEKLCDLCKPGDILGNITKKASAETGIAVGLPLIATGSDKGCETIGLSCTTPEKAAISFGTTATIQYTIDRYVEPQRFMPPYCAALRGSFSPEIEIFRGYWLISWFKKEFAEKETKEAEKLGIIAEELLNQRLKEIPAGCDGLVFQPYFTPGVSMPNARGAIIGFSDIHTRIHIYRAIIEGINFALMEGMKGLEKQMKIKTKEIYLAGGGSRSDEICQITADMFGLPVYRTQTHEAAVIGSSMIAFMSIGQFKNIEEATKAMVHIKDEFLPNIEVHSFYDQIYNNVFSKVFGKLKPLYDATKNFSKKIATNKNMEE